MPQPLFALIDCNNFFASCEQVFRPGLAEKPIVVLSSNDGCVVARSAEARAVGIPMGAPAFKFKHVFKEHNVLQFSANFELYGDISRRITEILTGITPRLEVYSIDESFLDISQLDIPDYTEWALQLRRTIYQWVGVTVSIGIAPSKTLAKLASERAKHDPSLKGVLLLNNVTHRKQHLPLTRVEEVWGIGRKFAPKLRSIGIGTAADVAALTPEQGRKFLGSVNGERLVRELNGQCCLELERTHTDQKMISVGRTFGHDTTEQHEVESALANFSARCAQKLRVTNRIASKITIHVSTDRHKPNYRWWGREHTLEQPSADTGELITIATEMFNKIYEKGTLYHRASVLLTNFQSNKQLQTDLLGFRDVTIFNQSKQRMAAIDAIRARYGAQATFYGTERLGKRQWQPRKSISSPKYTTQWEDLPLVRPL